MTILQTYSKQIREVRDTNPELAKKLKSEQALALVKFSTDLAKRDIDRDINTREELINQLAQYEAEAEWLNNLPAEEIKGDKEKMMQELRDKWQKTDYQLRNLPEYSSIIQMEKQEPERLEARVYYMLNDVAMFLNIGKNINKDQLRQTGTMLIEQAKGLTLEDIALMLHKAKQGEYGQVYDRLDGMIVLGWLKEYKKARQERIMAINQNTASANRSNRNRDSTHALGKPIEFKGLIDLQNLKK